MDDTSSVMKIVIAPGWVEMWMVETETDAQLHESILRCCQQDKAILLS